MQLPPMAAGTRLLLVVDQFEELFTTATADQVGRFEQALLRLIGAPDFYLIVAARADFYANLMASPLWPRIPPDHRLEVTPPRGDALREAIALPARDVGVQLEPQLVERLLADAGEEPGVLPFVQETLVRLWAHADRLVIGLDVYTDLVGDKSGRSGLQVALAEHADHVYGNVLAGKHERDIAERILLRLVQFGEGRPDTRRQQTVDELRKGSGEDGIFDKVLAAIDGQQASDAERGGAAGGPLARGADQRLAAAALVDRAAAGGRTDAAAARGEGCRAAAAAQRQPGRWAAGRSGVGGGRRVGERI